MSFRRVLRWLFWLYGVLAGVVGTAVFMFARRIIQPPRQRLWTTPASLDMDYEAVQFPAADGVRLSGWFIPVHSKNSRDGATVVLVHGWPWNRLGESAQDVLARLNGTTPVDLLRLAYALHQAGFHVLMFDLRNHGESAAAPPVTFGQSEANDLLGALQFLKERSEVNPQRIGVIGFSMGANTLLYALPRTDSIKAGIAVQPTTVSLFARRYGAEMMGILSRVVLLLVDLVYRLSGGPGFSAIQPAFVAAGAGETPILYVQGKGDRWGSVPDVMRMVEATPRAVTPLLVETMHRFEGYQYLINHPKVAIAFLEQYLGN